MNATLTAPILPNEIEWKFYGSYTVGSNGTIIGPSGKSVGRENNKGYFTFFNIDNGKDEKIHRVVAKCFLPNPDSLPQINHKDGNKLNNDVSNLEWCTQSENIKHAYDNGLMKKPTDVSYYNSTPVSLYKDGNLVGTFVSITECARQMNLSQGNLSMVLSGHRKHHKKYTIKYSNHE